MINRKRILTILFLFLNSLIFTSCTKRTAIIPPSPEAVHAIPSKPSVLRQDIYHKVAPGETIWRISKTYDVSAKSILEANDIKNSAKIEAGKILLIPQAYPRKTVIPLFKTNKWKYIILHHSATEFGSAYFFDIVHHRRGFSRGLGYHFVIDNGTMGKEDGQIEVGPRWIKQLDGAHTKASDMNHKGIGIVLVGDTTKASPTKRQMDSLVKLVNILREYYDIPLKNILGHNQVPGAATKDLGRFFSYKELKSRLRLENSEDFGVSNNSLQVIYVKE